jgi:hypothetical protein
MNRAPIAAPTSAPVKRVQAVDSQQFYEEKDPEAGLVPLSVICFIAAIALLVTQLAATDQVMSAPQGEESAFMIPTREDPTWEKYDMETRQYEPSTFDQVLPALPE